MNALALQLPCKSENPEQSVKLSLLLGPRSIDTVAGLLEERGYHISPALTPPSPKGHYCLLIDTDIDPHWITPFSRWLLKKADLASLETKLEDSEGQVIALCRLYNRGAAL